MLAQFNVTVDRVKENLLDPQFAWFYHYNGDYPRHEHGATVEPFGPGIRRILTVSADTELVSAPAYLRAAQNAPALNNFGSAMSIIQDELAHAHIGYRLLGDLGVEMDWLIYERPPEQFKYPYAFDVPLNSWVELVCANALYDQAGFVLLSDVYET